MRRIRVSDDTGLPWSCNTCLLDRNQLAAISQPVRMIESNTGDNAEIGVDNIHRIKASPESDLQHLNINVPLPENPERSQRGDLEIGQANGRTRLFNRLKRGDQLSILDLEVVDANSLIKTIEVGRGVAAYPLARVHQCGG